MTVETGLIRSNTRVVAMSYFMETMRSLGFNINISEREDNSCSVLFNRHDLFLKLDMGGNFTTCKAVLTRPEPGSPDVEILKKIFDINNLCPELLLEVQNHLISQG